MVVKKTSECLVPIEATLSPGQKQEVVLLIDRYQDVFSALSGKTQIIQHDIVTPPRVVVKQTPYRIPEAKHAAVKSEVEEMMRLGVIEESNSKWNNPIVLVPNPSGALRFCNDFCKLNQVSQFDYYPMPRVDELIESLAKCQYLTILDLTKVYWQIPLTNAAKEKTAFSVPEGLFQYKVLPSGLHGAEATFQRA